MKTFKTFTLLILLLPVLSNAQDVNLEAFASGFTRPIDIKHANDSRLFIVEQDGIIKILNQDGTTNTTPFLDIDARVNSNGNEQGLLSLTFDPDYATNNRFYVNYINANDETVVSRFTVSSDPNIADETSEEILLTISQPFSNHNAGSMAFANDGFLYIATGDGGSGGDPQNLAQNLQSLLGKILRIDVSGASSYTIPNSNPFVGDTSVLDEIWAYGLRNPWKISFDSDNGDLWIGDVGQSSREEINNVPLVNNGYNFGWKCYEGNNTFDTTNCPSASTITFPASEYINGGTPFRCSITGGYRYRGSNFPDFQGLYFFADFCSNEVGTLTPNGNTWTMTFNGPFSGGISTFGEDVNKELYAAGLSNGTIYKIVDTTLSLDEDTIGSNFVLYPNPVDDFFQIQEKNSTRQLDEVQLFSLDGKLISTVKINSEFQKIYTNTLNSGVYILQLISKNKATVYKKIIIN